MSIASVGAKLLECQNGLGTYGHYPLSKSLTK